MNNSENLSKNEKLSNNKQINFDKNIVSSIKHTLNYAFDIFISRYGEENLTQNTIYQYKNIYNNYISTSIGYLFIDEIKFSHLSELHFNNRHHPYQANRIRSICSKLFNWCFINGFKTNDFNPAQYVKPYKESKKLDFLNEKTLNDIWNIINDLENKNKINFVPAAALKILLLTGARKNEILSLQWKDINFENKRINLEKSKTGNRTILLNEVCIDILKSMPKISKYVFPGTNNNDNHWNDLRYQWKKIISILNLTGRWRIHDLRHGFASVAVNNGGSLSFIAHLLGHKNTSTTARYSHVADTPARNLLNNVINIIINKNQ
ncbi:MAG: site-specific integrase [Deltaproteobacteria bacterium]|jgi:integrase|nr:site-specific integrase [Deltaproteobacteria bacterium]